ncbi:MAG TPA: FHA domain-containing protein [Gemmatimonadaceae bacterium]|nr:FHA domain-containing protein [Gemmatimonadaceae bacterium]
MPVLELEGKPDLEGNPREFSGELMVGSGSQAAWRIAGQDLAARHFKVRGGEDGSAAVVPASPQNVVVVGGKQVPPSGAPLKSGDVIAAGAARFVFLANKDSKRPAPAAAPPDAHLIDATSKKGYTMRKRVVQIGREIGCSIVLKDPTVSRFHADVRGEAGEFVLYSMGSAGTKINGQPVTAPRLLVEGDLIQIGETTFTFSRAPLPPGVRPVQFEDHDDDAFSRRSTQLAQRAVTLEAGKYPTKSGREIPLLPMLVGGAVVSILVVLYLIFR